MYRILLIFGLICSLSRPDSFAQQNKADSLLSALSASKADTGRVNILAELCRAFQSRNIDSARNFATQAIELAQKIGDKKGLALALKNMGISYYARDNQESLRYWEKSLAVYRELKDSSGVANLLSNIGAIYMNEADDKTAAKYFMDALAIAETISDKVRIATVLNNMGSIYNHRASTRQKALDNYLRAQVLWD